MSDDQIPLEAEPVGPLSAADVDWSPSLVPVVTVAQFGVPWAGEVVAFPTFTQAHTHAQAHGVDEIRVRIITGAASAWVPFQ